MSLLPPYFTVKVAYAPLPAPFVHALSEIEIQTAVGQASAVRLHFDLSRNSRGDFDLAAFDIFQPLVPLTVKLSLGLGLSRALINAYVRDSRLEPSNTPGASRLEVVGLDALGTTMAHDHKQTRWPNCSDSVIATAIFGKYGIIPDVEALSPTRTTSQVITNQSANDAAYLFDLAGNHSYELYLQPDPVLGRDVGHFHSRRTERPHQGTLSIDFGAQTNLNSFHVANDMLRPTTVETSAMDMRTGRAVPAAGRRSADPVMGRQAALSRFSSPPVERPVATRAANPAEMRAQAEARATESSRTITASGEIDGLKFNRALLCGLPVKVRGPGSQDSGLYYVESVTHRIRPDSYTQSFRASRNAVGLKAGESFADPCVAAT